ncbi:MAG: HlyD family secretion protein [Gammaproteobacteria bacterium]
MNERIDIRPLPEFARAEDRETLLEGLPGTVPTTPSAIAGVVILVVVAVAAGLWAVPWVQTAPGSGRVTALHPADRLQTVNALVDGRINRWFVEDGDAVKAGAPIVEILDIDPKLLDRLRAERAAVARRLEAVETASATARFDYERQKQLYNEGLSARKDFESAKIRYQENLAAEAEARAALNKVDIGLSRQSSQVVVAPRDGYILQIMAGNTATVVKAGDPVARFAPADVDRAVEVFVSGLDAPLVQPGLSARVMFEGWPAVQFSGWPEAAIGTFAGIVVATDPVASQSGRFRVLIAEDSAEPWPPARYLRLGGQAQAWVQLGTVRLGYELWRRLNRFPPRPPDAPGVPDSAN